MAMGRATGLQAMTPAAAGFLMPLGPVAAAERMHLIEVTALTLIAVLPVLLGAPLIFWRYRRGRTSAAYRPQWGFSKPLEFAMWGVPLAIVAVLGVLLWKDSHRYAPARPLGAAPLEIDAVGLNWKWLFLYPGSHIASLGELVVPAGRPVTLKLTSDTVMQSFMAPSLAGQLYALPGMVTRLGVEADKPALAAGRNMQFSGNGFAGEGFTVRVLDRTDYRQWLASSAKSPVRLDASLYAKLAEPGSLAQARELVGDRHGSGPAMRLDDARLLDRIVARYHSGAPVAPTSQPGAPAYRATGATQGAAR